MEDFAFYFIAIVLSIFALLPWILPLMSKKVEGIEKFLWFLSGFLASWIGFLVFYFVVVTKKKPSFDQSNIVFESPHGLKRDHNGRVIKKPI